MKKLYINNKILLLIGILWMSFATQAQTFQPIQLNTNPNTDSCTSNGGNFQVSIPSEALTGDLIPLEITLPGTLSQNCDINFSIEYASPNNKINYVTSGGVALSQSGNVLSNSNPLAGNDGQNYIVWFKFDNYYTCNGEAAMFNVHFDTCNGSCDVKVSVKARADNYWTVKKDFVIGNLTCGRSKWYISVINSNPNPSGYGNYAISGSITETPTVPIANNTSTTFNLNNYTGNYYFFPIYLQNCQNEGTVITNTADYQFTLGDGCTVMDGTVSAVSDTLSSPNANISFSKYIYSTSGYPTGYPNQSFYSSNYDITPGCQGKYIIKVYNNGNVPWTNISIQDDLDIQELTITDIILPSGWTSSPSLTSPYNQDYIFTAPASFVLQPGSYIYLHVYFTVNGGSTGTIIPNTATISYNAYTQGSNTSTSGGTSSNCQGVNCPVIDTSIHNTTATANIHTISEAAKYRIKKCIINAPLGNIYQLGDTIHFRTIILNSGSGPLTASITDDLSSSAGQNLNLVGSPSYTYYEDNNIYYQNNCGNGLTNQQPISFVQNNSTSQNLDISINGMPGICEMNRANYLVVDFDAVVMPQMYGSKTNTAFINNMGSSVNYSVDQSGILEVNKYADQEYVDDGGSFNYIIKVTNSGTVPMGHISIEDQMPSCVTIGSGISVINSLGQTLNFTQSGNLNVTVDPNAQLIPGETITITVPAVRHGGGNQCCNEKVTAKGTMSTSGTVLQANYGIALEPAACVKSISCCEVEDFEAHLYENSNGTYQVSINGGVTPLQEVNISVIDYHAEYNHPDCQPQNMGIMGTLTTSSANIGGLLLDSSSLNTSSLSWGLGTATLLNASVNVDITKPNVLNLDCCNVDFYFCLKVSVKDVNCNVCEVVLCPEEEQKPCDINIGELNRSYCIVDDLNISWTSNLTSPVHIYLQPAGGGSAILLAGNQSPNGNITYNIPSTIACDQQWEIIVQDTASDECREISRPFIIKCCEPCNCLKWREETININTKTNNEQVVQPGSLNVNCGANINLSTGLIYEFSSPTYSCSSNAAVSCQASYSWTVTNNSNGSNATFIGENVNIQFYQTGVYTVVITPTCGNNQCEPCTFTVIVRRGYGISAIEYKDIKHHSFILFGDNNKK